MAAARKKHLDEFAPFQTRMDSLTREVDLETDDGRKALQEWCKGVVSWLAYLTKRDITRTVRERKAAKDDLQFFGSSIISEVSRMVDEAVGGNGVMISAEAGEDATGSSVVSDDGKVTTVVPPAPPVAARR